MPDWPKIRVMEPHPGCSKRWFDCHLQCGTPILATYEARRPDGDTSPVTGTEVDRVQAMHPGKDLVYV